MRQSGGTMKAIAAVFAGLFATIHPARGSALTPTEIQRYADDLGVVLSANEQQQIAAIAKPDGPYPQWRTDAEARIEQHRKANLSVKVVDANGVPVEGAQVAVRQNRSAFHFGGVLNLKDFTDEDGNLQISTNRYRELFLGLFNSAGLDNGLKPKQRAGNEPLLPGFFAWTQANGIPVRGHNLIWPGVDDANNHLPSELPDTATSYSAYSKVLAAEATPGNHPCSQA